MIWGNVFSAIVIYTNCAWALFIDDFSGKSDISTWQELSDSALEEGRSKASLVLQETETIRRAILFTLLNPQPCGAAIAGHKKRVQLDVTPYSKVVMSCRGQGEYNGFKFFLRHKGNEGINAPSFVHVFQAPKNFGIVSLDITNFKLYHKGKPTNSEPLDTGNVSTIGIIAYGGFNSPQKQSGVASLEINWIKLE